jgi:Zn-finger nucleic acid-binding protein
MNCPNCAAPLVLVPDRDYMFCEHCGTFHFLAESEDGVRVLEEVSDLRCPVCRETLRRAVLDRHPAWYCPRCRGALTAQHSFRQVVEQRRAKNTRAPVAVRPINGAELERRIACPRCGQAMDTHPYYGPGNIVIDNCPHCHVVWLDAGELRQAVNAPGRDRGKPRVPTPKLPPEERDRKFDILDIFWPEGRQGDD